MLLVNNDLYLNLTQWIQGNMLNVHLYKKLMRSVHLFYIDSLYFILDLELGE